MVTNVIRFFHNCSACAYEMEFSPHVSGLFLPKPPKLWVHRVDTLTFAPPKVVKPGKIESARRVMLCRCVVPSLYFDGEFHQTFEQTMTTWGSDIED